MRQLVRFGVAGVVGFIADAAVLYALLGLGLDAYLARALSFLFAVFVTWTINRRFTFASDRDTSLWREWGRYLLAMSLGGVCNYASYAAMLGVLPRHAWSPLFALAIGSLIGMVVNFLSAKFWVFAPAGVARSKAGPAQAAAQARILLVPASWLDAKKLAWLYVSVAVPSCLFLVAATPPFQTPDAVNHFFRAYQVSTGVLIGKHVGASSGGKVDKGVIAFGEFEAPLKSDKGAKWRQEMDARAATMRLSGERVDAEFPNTAPYPAWNYIPQALPMALFGHGHGLLLPLYWAACLINALIAIALTWLAIRMSSRARLLIFTIALLPMTLSLTGSVSQDASLIPLCFVLVAMIDRIIDDREVPSGRQLFGLAALMVLISTARLPYIGFVLFFLHPLLRLDHSGNHYALSKRLSCAAVTAGAALAVYVVHNRLAGGVTPAGSSLAGQAHYVMTHLSAIPQLARETLFAHGVFYATSFIGILGWLDTYFPDRYYAAAGWVMLVSWVAGMLPGIGGVVESRRSVLALFSLLPLTVSILLIFAGLYAFWSPVGGATVEGVQGRYFLPIAPLFGMACVPFVTGRYAGILLWNGVRAAAAVVIVGFPVVSFFEIVTVILHRYYIG